jgi:hypothetical protein
MGEASVAISIMQPWAGLIVHGRKDIENRSWPTRFRGPVLIHAGKKWDADAQDDLDAGLHPVTGEHLDKAGLTFDRGGIVGVAEIVDCVTASTSPWFVGEYGFVIRNARPLPFRPCRGQLGFFRPDFSPSADKPLIVPKAVVIDSQHDLFPTPLERKGTG